MAQARHRPGCIASLRDPKWRRRVSETVWEDDVELKNDLDKYKLLNKQGPLDKQQRREAGSLCRSGSAIFLNET